MTDKHIVGVVASTFVFVVLGIGFIDLLQRKPVEKPFEHETTYRDGEEVFIPVEDDIVYQKTNNEGKTFAVVKLVSGSYGVGTIDDGVFNYLQSTSNLGQDNTTYYSTLEEAKGVVDDLTADNEEVFKQTETETETENRNEVSLNTLGGISYNNPFEDIDMGLNNQTTFGGV